MCFRARLPRGRRHPPDRGARDIDLRARDQMPGQRGLSDSDPVSGTEIRRG